MRALQHGNIEAVAEISRRAVKGVEAIRQGAADYAKQSFKAGAEAAKAIASAQSSSELLERQASFVSSSIEAAFAESSRVVEQWLTLLESLAEPITDKINRSSPDTTSNDGEAPPAV
jgi:hypothetical protein